MNWIGRIVTACVFALCLSGLQQQVAAQEYPNHAIRITVPYAVGGSTDVLARLYGAKLSQVLGQPSVVDNQGGAGTLLGTRTVLHAPPDGYNLLFTTSAITVSAAMYRKAGYTLDDFKLVGTAGLFNHVLLITKSSPIRTVPDLIAYAKANPGKLNYASLGKGSTSQLLSQRFLTAAQINMVEVPYSGAGPAELALASGEVSLLFTGADTVHLQTDHSFPLAVTSEKRLAIAPSVPTFVEFGYKSIISSQWFAFFVPAATPKPVVDRLSQALDTVNRDKDIQATMNKFGIYPFEGQLSEFQTMITTDAAQVRDDIMKLGLQTDE